MLATIVVVVISLVLIAIALVVFFRWRSSTSHVRMRNKMGVRSISSVGISAQAPKVDGASIGNTSYSATGTTSSGTSNAQRNRFLAVGIIVAAAFSALAVKLFGLQVVSSASYQREAESNLYTTVRTPAPRGVIYDRDGVPLVTNRQVQTVLADADVANNTNVILRLSALLGIPYDVVRARILDASTGAQSQRVVAKDVRLRDVAYINEHRDAFPGISTQIRSDRIYPYGALAAHVLGYTGASSKEDLENVAEGRDIEMGDAVGKAGIEQSYDDVLAGDHGQRTFITDASGEIQQVVSESDPAKGNDIYLTIAAPVQYVADTALRELVQGGTGTAASLVCIDVKTGGVLAMANYPSYEPEHFIGGISQDMWNAYQTEESHYPLMNRAIAGTYPAASCFKAFTGLAGLTYGFADATKAWNCTGTWTGFGEEYPQKCWEHSGHGWLTFREGIVVSCDVVFYEIARDFYNARNAIGDEAMQDFIKEFGYSALTNIDLAGEAQGRIPTPEWKSDYFRDVPTEAQWLPGDISNMAIGQGYVLVTPLQVARGYAAVATGKLLQPHLLKEVRNSAGEVVVEAPVVENATPDVSEANYQIVRDALRGVATENHDVSNDFSSYDFTFAAKTGTAEVAGKQDFAWFACYAPYEDPRFALALCIEEGGSGGAVASPVAARVMKAAIDYSNGVTIDYEKISVGTPGKTQQAGGESNE